MSDEVSHDFSRALDPTEEARSFDLDATNHDAEAEKRRTDEGMWKVHEAQTARDTWESLQIS